MQITVACCLVLSLLMLQSDGSISQSEMTRLGDNTMIQTDSLNVDEIYATVHCNCHCYCDQPPGRPGPSTATLAFQGFYYCQTGPVAFSLPHNCVRFDVDEDGDVDMRDFADLQRKWGTLR